MEPSQAEKPCRCRDSNSGAAERVLFAAAFPLQLWLVGSLPSRQTEPLLVVSALGDFSDLQQADLTKT